LARHFRCPETQAIWVMTYPEGHLQGGGPPLLTRTSDGWLKDEPLRTAATQSAHAKKGALRGHRLAEQLEADRRNERVKGSVVRRLGRSNGEDLR